MNPSSPSSDQHLQWVKMLPEDRQSAAMAGLARAKRQKWLSHVRNVNDVDALSQGCYFCKKAAARVVRYFQTVLQLKHPRNPRVTIPFDPLPWQKTDVLEPVFGWKQANGLRRFKKASIWIPKKNGKSPLASGIISYLLLADDEPEPEVYSAATTTDQAAIVYRELKKMVNKSPDLQAELTIKDHIKKIECEANSGFYKVLSGDADGADGINPHGIVLDELHRQKTRELFDTLAYATIARAQPLTVIISTAGDNIASIGYEECEIARKVQAGIIRDIYTYGLVFAADEKDDWTSPATWRKANPSMGYTIDEKTMAADCKEAQITPAKKPNFLRFRLNRWVGRGSAFMNMPAWLSITEPVHAKDLVGVPCHAGLDLSSNTDLASLVLKFKVGNARKLLCYSWLPEDCLIEKEQTDGVPYRAWVEQGHLRLTPGDFIDLDFIERDIQALHAQHPMQEVAYDPTFASQLAVHLQAAGVPVFSFWQRATMMTPVLNELDRLTRAGQIHHGHNPVLTWAMSNLEVTTNADGFMKPVKGKGVHRIDPAIATLMSLGPDLKGQKVEEPSHFELCILE